MAANKLSKFTALAIVAFSFYLVVDLFIVAPHFIPVDFPAWRGDWRELLCQIKGQDNCRPVSKFPFAYLINSMVSSLLGDGLAEFLLFCSNIIVIIFSIYFVMYATKVNSTINHSYLAYGVSLIFTVLPAFYINSGALEVHYGVVLGVYASSVWLLVVKKRKNENILKFCYISAFLLPFYKDISLVLIVFFSLSAVLAGSSRMEIGEIYNTFSRSKNFFLKISISLILSLSIVMIYNIIRYDNILPLPYIEEGRQAAPENLTKIFNFFWIFLSPNGGLLISWSSAFVVLFVCLNLLRLRVEKSVIITALGILLFSAIILANWWTPFGWEGWGNRLIIPILIAFLIFFASVVEPVSNKNNYRSVFFGGGFGFFGVLSYLTVIIFFGLSLFYISIGYSKFRYEYLNYSLWGTDSCKAVGVIRDTRPMWEFKKTHLHLKCHLERFTYIPGEKKDTSPLAIVEKKYYKIGNGNGAGVIGEGWSHVEEWGVWSNSKNAEIRFLSIKRSENVVIELRPFIYGDLKRQQVNASIDNVLVYSGYISEPTKISFSMRDVDFNPDKVIKIILELPDAKSPAQVGLNADQRSLSVGLTSIEFE